MSEEPPQQNNTNIWEEIRDELVIIFLIGISVWMLIPLASGFFLALELGFTVANITTPSIAVLFLITLFFRERLTTRMISIIITVGMSVVYLIAVYNYGLFSSANVWFFPIVLMVSILLGRLSALLFAAVLLIGFMFAGYGYITGRLHLPADANAYMSSQFIWIIQISFGIIVFGFITSVVSKMQSALRAQIDIINEKNIRITYLANHDSLTGLATLHLMHERFELARQMANRSEKLMALLFIDLDYFKSVNDTFGHDTGDAVLKEVAIRLQKEIRESDTACRIGGDEFLIILSEVKGKAEVGILCQRLIESVSQPVLFNGHKLEVGVSIGAALYPEKGGSFEELRKCADTAMYDVKTSGKSNFSIAS